MIDTLRPILARLIAPVVASVATWAAAKWGLDIDENARGAITNGTLEVLLAIWGIVYAITHKSVNSKLNPEDAASVARARQSRQDQKRGLAK